MRPVFSDIVGEIQRSIGFYQSVHADADLKRLIGLGSTFRLPGLRKYLKQQLQLDVYRLEQFKKLNMEGPRAGEFQASSVNMATAYGCANQVFSRAPLLANLMPVSVLKEAMWKRKVPYFAIGAGLAAAAAGAMFIRPLLDSTAFEGADKPAVLQNVADEANRLARNATEAGVTSDANVSMEAAEIVSLVDDRALYAAIFSDASQLVSLVKQSAAEQVQAGSPIGTQLGENNPFKLVPPNTDYMDSPSADAGGPTGGRSGRKTDPSAGGGEFEQSIGNLRRVKVTAVFDVPLPSSTLGGFRDDIVEPILRDKLPELQSLYAIKYNDASFWSTDAESTTRTTNPRNVINNPTRPTTRGTSDSSDLKSIAPFDFSAQPQPQSSTRVTMTWYAVLDLNASEGDE